MRRWRSFIIGVACAFLVLPASVSASPAQRVLVVTGSRSASVELDLAKDTTFDLSHMTSSGSGRYAGIYLEPIDVPAAQRERVGRHSGAIAFRDVREPRSSSYVFPFVAVPPAATKAGRYRLYLFTDSAVVLRVPISGARSLSLRPSRPVVVSFAGKADILTSPIEAKNTQPLRLTGSRSVSMSAMLIFGFRAFAGDVGTCLRAPGSQCGSATSGGGDGPYTSVGISPIEDYGLAFRVSYMPGAIAPGQYEAYQGALNAGGLKYASGAAFSFRLE